MRSVLLAVAVIIFVGHFFIRLLGSVAHWPPAAIAEPPYEMTLLDGLYAWRAAEAR